MSEAAQQRAEATGAAMYERDRAARQLGIELEAIAPGWARAGMTVRRDMLDLGGQCHPGMVFTLADTCFAYACNSHNSVAVARHCTINFLQPGQAGDRLTATAEERSKGERNGVYDVTVVNDNGETVAMFRGNSRTLQGQLVVPGDEGEMA